MLDVDFVRSLYPAFTEGEYREWAFFENAGGSCIPRPVLEPFSRFLSEYKVQPYAPYAMSLRAGEAMDAGYGVIAELLNADPDELTIGPSTTLNTYVLAQAMIPVLAVGDEIVVTNQDHEANIGCWRRLARHGVVVKQWSIDPRTGQLDVDELEPLLSARTRLVCFTLCSNVVGTFNDVGRITAMVRDAGAMSIGDGVSYAPHRMMDVRESGLDFYLFSTYKTFAPHTGVMWGRAESLRRLEPQGHEFNRELPRYRFNPTGPLHAEIAALSGLAPYLEQIHDHHVGGDTGFREKARTVFDLFAAHEQVLADRLLRYLETRDDLRVIGHPRARDDVRAATIAFTSSRRSSREIVTALADARIGCSHGHFYAKRCIEALGIDAADGVVRVSLVHYNTQHEVDRLIEALDRIA